MALGNHYYKDLEYEHGITCRNTAKKYQNNHNTMNRTEQTKQFLLKCRKNRLTPTFIINRTKHLMGRETATRMNIEVVSLIRETNRKILNIEIKDSMREMSYLKTKAKNLHNKLYRLAPQHIINTLISNIRNNNSISFSKKTTTLNSKYEKLIITQTPKIQYNKEWIKNLSDVSLPDDVLMMLALGPKFAVYQRKNEVPVGKIIADVENIISNSKNKQNHNLVRGQAANIISNHNHMVNHTISRKQLVLHQTYITTKKFLSANPDLIITTADKGNVSIVMNKMDYTQLITDYFDDKTVNFRSHKQTTNKKQQHRKTPV